MVKDCRRNVVKLSAAGLIVLCGVLQSRVAGAQAPAANPAKAPALPAKAPDVPAKAPGVPAKAPAVEVEPIKCWWRLSADAVRVGEPFAVALTCAVLENDAIQVEADQSRLDPTVLQLPPFEVVGGTHDVDLRSANRRFFQYQYSLRLIKEDQFGKDVKLPQLQISYRIRSQLQQNASLLGRDRSYLLPPASVRMLSLVAPEAHDIRDATDDTFGDVEARLFRANALVIAAATLAALGVMAVIAAVVGLVRRRRQRAPVMRSLLSDGVVLRGLDRELSFVRRARLRGGWTDELAARALAAFRVAGGYALSRQASQCVAPTRSNAHDGQVLVRGGWLGQKRVFVSGPVTSETISLARESDQVGGAGSRLEGLQTALMRLTLARYGRNGTVEDADLDESLESGLRLLRWLRIQNLWPVRTLNGFRARATELGTRMWAR